MRRYLTLAAMVVLALTPACGSGDEDQGSTGTVAQGPLVIAVPFIPFAGSTEAVLVGLRNLSTAPARVWVRAFRETGAPYSAPIPVDLPPQGAVRAPLSNYGPGGFTGGWVEVETRDLTVVDPATGEPAVTATSGFVAAYLQRSQVGVDTGATMGTAFRPDFSYTDITEKTFAYQVVNRSYDPTQAGSPPVAADINVRVYGPGPTPVVTPINVAPNGSRTITIGGPVTGRVEVTPVSGAGQTAPPGTVFSIAVTTQENAAPVMIEGRLTDIPRGLAQRDVGFALEFGREVIANWYDFGVMVTNVTDTPATIQLRSIRRADGTAILATPILIDLAGRATKYLATTTTLSRGLAIGEESPFRDPLFGDVGLVTPGDVDVFFLDFSVPESVEISARQFPAALVGWYRLLPGRKLTTDAIVCGVQVPQATGTGVANVVHLMNPRNSNMTVQVRGFTPGGTEYVLDPVEVGPYMRFDWSPDGMTFREEPSATAGPVVEFMAFRFTSTGGIYVDARRIQDGVADIIAAMVPHAVRDLRAD